MSDRRSGGWRSSPRSGPRSSPPISYALHDALAKPLPGNDMAPCLAESWRESADGLTYEFKLREGLRFHNGDPFTAEDVKFSFHAPWPDFLAFYATPATGAAWVVPKKYIEKVGEEGFKKHPVGLGPYRFVRLIPGVELTLEANEQYWRKKPSIKRLVIKGIPTGRRGWPCSRPARQTSAI